MKNSILSEESEHFDKKNKIKYFNKVNKYFDKQKKELQTQFDLKGEYKFIFSKDKNGEYVIELMDANKKSSKPVLKGHYDVVGVYNLHNSVWYWGWNIDLIDKKLTRSSRSVKKFSKYIKKKYKEFDPVEAEELIFKTQNGNFYTKINNIKPLVKLMMYLNEGLWYLSICHGKDETICLDTGILDNDKDQERNSNTIKRVEYIIIKDIMQVS